jgi:hypothetical protein
MKVQIWKTLTDFGEAKEVLVFHPFCSDETDKPEIEIKTFEIPQELYDKYYVAVVELNRLED